MKVPIPVATVVKFFRPTSNVNSFDTKILASHICMNQLEWGLPNWEPYFVYELEDSTCPYVVGFAHEDEIFTEERYPELVELVHLASIVEKERLKQSLINQIMVYNTKLEMLEKEITGLGQK